MIQRVQELHALPLWLQTVEATRETLGPVATTQEGLERRLRALGPDAVVHTMRAAYRSVVAATGLSDRYAPYFAACALTHRGAARVHDSPLWLVNQMAHPRFPSDRWLAGQVRLTFFHRDQDDPDGGGAEASPLAPFRDHQAEAWTWQRVSMPYGVEVLWPYEVPLLTWDPEDWARLQTDLRADGVPMTWVLMDRLVAVYRDAWLMLPLRVAGPLSQAYTLPQVYQLPAEASLVRMTLPIPMAVDGSGARLVTALDPFPGPHPDGLRRFRHLGEVRPMAPRVIIDPGLPRDEKTFAEMWQRLVKHVTVHPRLQGGRGAPARYGYTPGVKVYSHLVGQLYRDRLARWGEAWRDREQQLGHPPEGLTPTPPDETRRSLWETARREGRRRVTKKEHRDRIPKGLQAQIDAEEPWKSP